MAITKTSAQILSAAQTLVAVAASPGNPGNLAGKLSDLRAVFENARSQYVRERAAIKDVTASGADAAAFFAAESISDGDAFRVSSTADTTDTVLADAKGSAVAANDVFNRVGAGVAFVGIAANVPADVTGLDAAIAG